MPVNQPQTTSPAARESHVPFVAFGSYPARPGNLVRPLVDGVGAFRRIGEAIEAARHSVWLTVAFFASDFAFPDGGGTLFDVLDRAVGRGLDVRAVFWRPNPQSSGYGRTFRGSPAEREMLRARKPGLRIRWDRAHGAYCQHQKSWIIDAGAVSETAFVGGINLTDVAMGSPGHEGGTGRHDVYVEVRGPSASDIHHNFVQRWNEASERGAEDGRWGDDGAAGLAFPTRLAPPCGDSLVQIQRMVHPGRYGDATAAPGARRYDIAAGECSILEQYRLAIEAARSSIYIENQVVPVPEIARGLERALKRGVEVVVLVPAEPERHVRDARRNPDRKALFEQMEALGAYETFALVGIAAADAQARRRAIYVHAKIMLVDDAWATIGSCNLHAKSLSGHTEMNASFWDPAVVRRLRCELFAEHLNQDTSAVDDRAALRAYRRIAMDNRRRRDEGNGDWQGLAFDLPPVGYAR